MSPLQREQASTGLWQIVFLIGERAVNAGIHRHSSVLVLLLTCQPQQERSNALRKIRMYALFWLAAADFF